MLQFVPLAQGDIERQPGLVEFWETMVGRALQHPINMLKVEDWFQEGHGIVGWFKDAHGIWIPKHAENGRVYLWAPLPIIVDVALLEECLKAIQKRLDTFHIFMILRLFSPTWIRMFYKLANFIFTIPVGSLLWPHNN